MEGDYSSVEELLENPGTYIFQLNDLKNPFPSKKRTYKYDKNIDTIKKNIIGVFQKIAESIGKYNEQNQEYLNHIIKNLTSRYNNKNKFNFPGLQVINMDREKLHFFSHWPDKFLICEKTDGVRYLLVQYSNGICNLIARNLEFFEIYIPEKLPPSPYRINGEWGIDYLLDGELVLDDVREEEDKSRCIKLNGKYKKINYLIFDAIIIKGLNYGHFPFKRRLEEFSNIFMKEYENSKYIKNCAKNFVNNVKKELKQIAQHGGHNSTEFPNVNKLEKNIKSIIPCTELTYKDNNKSIFLYMKDYFDFTQLKKLNNFIKLLPHHNDGIIINVDDYPYYSGQSCEIFKWKPIEMNTIDFEIKYNKEKNRYILCSVGNEVDKINLIPVEILCFESDEEEKKFEKIYNNNNDKKCIAECFYDNNICDEKVAINNYYLSKEKKDKNGIISFTLENFPEKLDSNIKKEELKGGWRFLKLRTDKSSGNYINTYKNIKECIKENLHMEEILETIKKNKNIKLNDLDLEKKNNSISAMSSLVWKKFFKVNKNDDFDDLDEDFFHPKQKEEKKEEKFTNKKRKKPESNNVEENEYDDNVNDKNDKDDDDDQDDNFDKLYDDDYGDDFY